MLKFCWAQNMQKEMYPKLMIYVIKVGKQNFDLSAPAASYATSHYGLFAQTFAAPHPQGSVIKPPTKLIKEQVANIDTDRKHCFIYDESYHVCLQLVGKQKRILAGLARLCSTQTGLIFRAKINLNRKFRGQTHSHSTIWEERTVYELNKIKMHSEFLLLNTEMSSLVNHSHVPILLIQHQQQLTDSTGWDAWTWSFHMPGRWPFR